VQELLRDCAPVSVSAAAFLIRLLRVEWSFTGKRVAILSQQLLRPTIAALRLRRVADEKKPLLVAAAAR
jgi:hypothetical protein